MAAPQQENQEENRKKICLSFVLMMLTKTMIDSLAHLSNNSRRLLFGNSCVSASRGLTSPFNFRPDPRWQFGRTSISFGPRVIEKLDLLEELRGTRTAPPLGTVGDALRFAEWGTLGRETQMPSIYDLLKADHAIIIQQLVELQNGLSSSEAEHSFLRLQQRFKLHAEFENVVFYPTLRAEPEAGQQLSDSVRDHTQIQKLLNELSDLDVTFPEWQDIIDELTITVERYAWKEEALLLPIAYEVIDDKLVEAMAVDYQRMRDLTIENVNAHPEG